MKKFFKILGILIIVLVLLAVAIPFIFKTPIENQVKKAINNNLNAEVQWSQLDLSVIKSFPYAQVKLEDVRVINKAPFEGDTLLEAGAVYLKMNLPQLWKSDDAPLEIKDFNIKEATANIIIAEDGAANYDISKKTEDENRDEEKGARDFALNIQHYRIENTTINYTDRKEKIYVSVHQLNHEGTGDFSAKQTTLKTKTTAALSFKKDSVVYFTNAKLDWDAELNLDLAQKKYEFEQNRLLFNQLPLRFKGWIRENEDNNEEVKLTFETPTSDFKNFLGVMPEIYTKDLKEVKTSGEFGVSGRMEGVYDEHHIPKLNIWVKAENASFKYPDLPKAVQNISFSALLSDETGRMEDLNLKLDNLTFRIDQDIFSAKGSFKNLMGNTLVQLSSKGKLNLGKLQQAYPLDLNMDLNGVLDANLTTSFTMEDLDKKHYEKIKSSGIVTLEDFEYSSDDFPHPIAIDEAKVNFDPGNVRLEKFNLTTGETDIQMTGKLENLMGFLFKKQPVKGDFQLNSNVFALRDFMTADTTSQKDSITPAQEDVEAIKIPAFLDLQLNFKANRILYKKMTLHQVSGVADIHDERIELKSVKADVFGGGVNMDAQLSTKTDIPKYSANMKLTRIDFSQSVEGLDLLGKMAPIAKVLEGKLSTDITVNGGMTPQLSPIYPSLTGSGTATILDAVLEKSKISVLEKLNSQLHFIDPKDIQLKDINLKFEFEDGGVNFEPINFKIRKDIAAKLLGRHTFDGKMDYKLDLDLPAKYLGDKVGKELSKLTSNQLKDTNIELPISITGPLKQPKFNVDFNTAVKEISHKLVDAQKENLKEKATDALGKLLGNKRDSTQQQNKADSSQTGKKDLKSEAKDLLEGLFGNKKKASKKEKQGEGNKK